MGLFLFCFSSIAVAELPPDYYMNKYIPKLQGTWYDINGNPVFTFVDRTLNGCPIIGIYNVAGGGGDFGCILRIVEKSGYRDLALDFENLTTDPNTYHQVMEYDQQAFRRTQQLLYHETVGGLGLGMSDQDVKAKYGNPDVAHTYSMLGYQGKFQANFTDDSLTKAQSGFGSTFNAIDELKQGMTIEEVINKYGKPTFDSSRTIWKYTKLGLELGIDSHIINYIKIYNTGDRRFDSSGFNCSNSIAEYKQQYGIERKLTGTRRNLEGAYSIGYNEYLWFNDYPNSVTLSVFWN